MVTGVAVVTGVVVIANVPVVAPAATVTDAGTDAAVVLLLTSDTTAPPTGAAAPRVTVPVLPAPPVTEAAFRASDDTAGFTVTVAVFDIPLYVAVMVAAV